MDSFESFEMFDIIYDNVVLPRGALVYHTLSEQWYVSLGCCYKAVLSGWSFERYLVKDATGQIELPTFSYILPSPIVSFGLSLTVYQLVHTFFLLLLCHCGYPWPCANLFIHSSFSYCVLDLVIFVILILNLELKYKNVYNITCYAVWKL